jgi:outer membrane murein-binding lipoprotein Lpp
MSLTFWFAASCSSTPKKGELTDETVAEWNATVDEIIEEPDRAARLKDLGSQLIDVSESIEQDVDALNREIMALNEDYDATEQELQELVGDFRNNRNIKFAQFRDIIFAMRSEVSEDEWKHLMK